MIISSWPSNNAEVRGTNPPSSWKFALTLYSALHICGPASVIQPASDQVVLSSLFGRSVMPDSLQLHGLQHARLPCPSLSPGVCSNSCPSSRWCHPTISSSVVPFCPQSFQASGSFPMCQLFTSGGQRIGVSAPVLAVTIQGWFSLALPGLISLQCKELQRLQESSPAPQFKSINSSVLSLLYGPTLTFTHDYWRNHSFD